MTRGLVIPQSCLTPMAPGKIGKGAFTPCLHREVFTPVPSEAMWGSGMFSTRTEAARKKCLEE